LRPYGGLGRIGLDLKQSREVRATDDGFASHVIRYSYRLIEAGGSELLAHHWHPVGLSPVTHPHLHLSSRIPALSLASGTASIALEEVHLPTGWVTVADIVRLLIEELGAAPRRPD
jgi:hypothetical protein